MNRRHMLKTTAIAGGMLILGGVQLACGDTKQLARWTGIVITSLKDVLPILGDMGAGSIVALIGRAIPIAEKLKKAFEDNDHAAAFTFLDNLINPQNGIIVEIATAVGLLQDEARKKLVLGLLAIGMVALRLISANIVVVVPPAGQESARAGNPEAAKNIERAAAGIDKVFAAVKF